MSDVSDAIHDAGALISASLFSGDNAEKGALVAHEVEEIMRRGSDPAHLVGALTTVAAYLAEELATTTGDTTPRDVLNAVVERLADANEGPPPDSPETA